MLGLKAPETPMTVDWNCAMIVVSIAKIGTPQPNAEYGMNSLSFDTLKDPL